MPSSVDISLLASAARSAPGSGASIDLGIRTALQLDLVVSALSGVDPVLQVQIETSKDGASWRLLDRFDPVSEAGPRSRTFAGADRHVRASWTLEGTGPEATFALSGQALLVYCTPDEVRRLGVAAEALASIDPSVLAEHLVSNTDDIDDRFCKRFKLPLVRWPQSLRKHLATITAWTVMSHRGVNPNTGDSDIQKRHDKAWKDVLDVAENRAGSPEGYVDSTPTTTEDGTYTFSRPRRR